MREIKRSAPEMTISMSRLKISKLAFELLEIFSRHHVSSMRERGIRLNISSYSLRVSTNSTPEKMSLYKAGISGCNALSPKSAAIYVIPFTVTSAASMSGLISLSEPSFIQSTKKIPYRGLLLISSYNSSTSPFFSLPFEMKSASCFFFGVKSPTPTIRQNVVKMSEIIR